MGDSTRNFLHCVCGAAIPFSAGECGSEVACPACGTARVAPPLSTLRDHPIDRSEGTKPRGFSLGTLLAFTAVWGLTCYGALAPRRSAKTPVVYDQPIDRSWESGGVEVGYQIEGGLLKILLTGSYPDAAEGLHLKYSYWLQPDGEKAVFVLGGQRKLTQEFKHASGGYDFGGGHHPELLGPPVRVLVDYEIWNGDVGKGTLLHKDSVFSSSFRLPTGDEL
ncbi:hypothetical protein Pla123a_21130 [Posidoniimonas polymericola]|uniref:Uncharacterized protein n=1 Tax=Posidoniimonas polymericola TaxID=2528002 RepID=A0A5C5YR83_9BACT|nr:hypothetical protein [Posidoniimonas polymericola]TWT77452.1 hypothetical protein Pla123a_21130 [Posidoniimonas polymericola]